MCVAYARTDYYVYDVCECESVILDYVGATHVSVDYSGTLHDGWKWPARDEFPRRLSPLSIHIYIYIYCVSYSKDESDVFGYKNGRCLRDA